MAHASSTLGVEILSTGGTARRSRQAEIKVTEVSDLTGFPEILDGRVKPHPKVFGGLLALRNKETHSATWKSTAYRPSICGGQPLLLKASAGTRACRGGDGGISTSAAPRLDPRLGKTTPTWPPFCDGVGITPGCWKSLNERGHYRLKRAVGLPPRPSAAPPTTTRSSRLFSARKPR